MKKTAVFDIEATNWINFACLGFFDGDDYKVFWSVEGFLDYFLTRRYRGYKCYAHFGGKYDFRFLIPYLVECQKYTIRFLERGNKIMSLKITCNKSKCSWVFTDSYFLLPMSLRELGKNFQIKYMKLDFDVESCKTIEDFAKPEPQEYLKHDCFGLYEILEKFSTWGLNGGKLKGTLPSQSLHVYTQGYLKRKLYVLPENKEEFIRQTYFGGRVEIFKMEGENLFYYDFNSLYPSVMLEAMPVGQSFYVETYYPEKIGFYKIKANMGNVAIPPLPVLVNSKLYFPKGEGTFYTTTAEIELLIKQGIKFKVIEGLVFDEKEVIFKEYIESMYKLRCEYPKGTMENLISKLLMNSLYGRFGMKREQSELLFSFNPPMGAKVYDEKHGLYKVESVSRSPYILPYLASYITSLARARLYNLILQAGMDKVFYCDTDSLITSTKLPVGEGLGELKLEYEIKKAVFLQPKAYAFSLKKPIWDEQKKVWIKEIVKVKGMKELKVGLPDFIKSLNSGSMEGINTKYYNIMGFRECIKRDKSLKINRKEVYKQLNSFYNKRIIKGSDTEAFEFNKIGGGQLSM